MGVLKPIFPWSGISFKNDHPIQYPKTNLFKKNNIKSKNNAYVGNFKLKLNIYYIVLYILCNSCVILNIF